MLTLIDCACMPVRAVRGSSVQQKNSSEGGNLSLLAEVWAGLSPSGSIYKCLVEIKRILFVTEHQQQHLLHQLR
jgi:hypothetical protein